MSISAMEYAGSECLDAGERSRVRSLIWIQSEERDFDGVGPIAAIQWLGGNGAARKSLRAQRTPRVRGKALPVQETEILYEHPL